jgi:glutathione synthase/RimK-type ligase-like ATP-grasp enzyme
MNYQNYLDGTTHSAAFMKMEHEGIDLKPLQQAIEQEIEKNPRNAAALLDSATLMFMTGANASGALKFIKGRNAYALQRQQAAFDQTVFYKLRCTSPLLRVLVLAAPGEIYCNAPVEFLLQNGEIETIFWYVLPDREEAIPEHDIAIVAASLAKVTKPATDRIQKMLQNWPKPVINRIENIQKFNRDRFFTYANDIAGLHIPETKRVSREEKPPFPYPFIIRLIESFSGQGLVKIEQPSDLSSYLNTHSNAEFFVSPFIDYSSADGLFRKYRIAVIDGQAFPSHMAITEKWAVWYYNAGMAGNEKKISEENDFLENFTLGKKYGEALYQLAKKIGSEYFVLDCAETKTGELLIFEGGHDMIVHDMDSPKHMQKLFHAFQKMLISHAGK